MPMPTESCTGRLNLVLTNSEYTQFEKSTIFSMSLDMSWALWDSKTQKLQKKIKLVEEVSRVVKLT
jgi:hypothetical protein